MHIFIFFRCSQLHLNPSLSSAPLVNVANPAKLLYRIVLKKSNSSSDNMDRWRLVSNVLRRGLANGHSVWSVCQSVWIMRMPQIAVMSQRQGNSQRGVGTACHSKAGSHNQGCHWRKRLESCIEKERGAERSKVKGTMKKKGSRQQREREEWHATPRDTEQGRTRARIQGGKKEEKRCKRVREMWHFHFKNL